jgi:hypothetical protein
MRAVPEGACRSKTVRLLRALCARMPSAESLLVLSPSAHSSSADLILESLHLRDVPRRRCPHADVELIAEGGRRNQGERREEETGNRHAGGRTGVTGERE